MSLNHIRQQNVQYINLEKKPKVFMSICTEHNVEPCKLRQGYLFNIL